MEIFAEYIPSKENFLADLCSRAYSNNEYFSNFQKLLQEKVLVLDTIYYEKFNFEIDW